MRKNKKETFMQGITALIFSQIIIKCVGLLYRLYLTNKEGFGDRGNAIYGSGFQIYALLLTLSSVGVPSAISKLVSEKTAIGDNRGAHRIFKVSLITFGIIGFIGTCILFFKAELIANSWLQMPEAELTLIALSPSIFFVSIASTIRGYFNGKGLLKITAKSQTVEQIFKTTLTIVIVEIVGIFSSLNTEIMAAAANLATALSTVMSFSYLIMYYMLKRKETYQEIESSITVKRERIKVILKRILAVSIPISISAILCAVNKNIDSITVIRLLKTFMEEEQAKIQYGILNGKVDTLITLPLSFNIAFATVLVPAVAGYIANGQKQRANEKISFSILISILIGIPCTIGMYAYSKEILELLFPNASEGVRVLQLSSITIFFTMLMQTITGALQGMGKVLLPVISLIIGVTCKLIVNMILIRIPSIGINGAVIGTIVCYLIADLISLYGLVKNSKMRFSLGKMIIKPIFMSLLMIIISKVLYTNLVCIVSNNIATIIALIFAIIIYITLVIILKIFNENEILMFPYGEKLYRILKKCRIY